jgi:hypothetical protein
MGERASAQLEIDYLRDELSKLRKQVKDEQSARDLLKKRGFFTDNLWSVEDIRMNYECTEEEAQEVLMRSLTNDHIMSEIWGAIDMFAKDSLLKRKEQ